MAKYAPSRMRVPGDPGIVTETRALLRAYLARTLDRHHEAARPT